MKKYLIPIFLLMIFFLIVDQPTLNKNWSQESKVLPEIFFNSGNTNSDIKIDNIKNFSYGNTESEKEISYSTKTISSPVKNIYFLVNPFWGYNFAHTYLTFEFENSDFLSVSVEARKKVDQDYNPLLGFFNFYNLFYMIVDEKDITTLRTVVRDDPLYSYKLKLTQEEKNNLLNQVMKRANKTKSDPEFYNTVFSSCTTNVFDSVNSILDKENKIGFDWKILFPEDSAKIFYDKKMLAIDYEKFPTYEQLKQNSNIQQVARENRNLDSKEFSKIIHSQ